MEQSFNVTRCLLYLGSPIQPLVRFQGTSVPRLRFCTRDDFKLKIQLCLLLFTHLLTVTGVVGGLMHCFINTPGSCS
jgi:hypothetical protein